MKKEYEIKSLTEDLQSLGIKLQESVGISLAKAGLKESDDPETVFDTDRYGAIKSSLKYPFLVSSKKHEITYMLVMDSDMAYVITTKSSDADVVSALKELNTTKAIQDMTHEIYSHGQGSMKHIDDSTLGVELNKIFDYQNTH